MVEHHLDHLFARPGYLNVVEGGAKGADRCAGRWAARMRSRGVGWVCIDAEWERHDREGLTAVPCRCGPSRPRCNAAGVRRNAAMLTYLLQARDLGHAVGVLAFHDDLESSRGTLDMVTRAAAAGVPVKYVTH